MSTPEDERLGRDSRLRRYENLAEMIGDAENPTPLLGLHHVRPDGDAALYVKLEWMSPFGSVKDRTARWMLDALESRGELEGKTVLEATSGNTGIALAGISALMGHPMAVTVPYTMPPEKAVLLEALGAELLLTPAQDESGRHPMDIAFDMAEEMRASRDTYVVPNQYDNPDNSRAHYESTGPEIWRQTEGRIDYFFAGYGTCGTLTGAGRYLKEQNPGVRVIAIEPVEGHHITGLKNLTETRVPGILDRDVIDEVVTVDDEQTREMALRLHREESLFAGPSACAIIAGAVHYLGGREGIGVAIAPDSSMKAIGWLREILGR